MDERDWIRRMDCAAPAALPLGDVVTGVLDVLPKAVTARVAEHGYLRVLGWMAVAGAVLACCLAGVEWWRASTSTPWAVLLEGSEWGIP